jgi:hypothetical protein
VGLAVFFAIAPRRLRAATYLVLAAVPVLPALPTLLDVFQHGTGGPGLVPFLRDAAHAVVLTSLGSVALAALFIRGVEARLNLGHKRVQLLSRIAAVAAIGVLAVGGTVFVASRGGPIKFVDQRVKEFNRGEPKSLQSQGTRFGVNVGTERGDFWRVALDQGENHPLLGDGPGSFTAAYLQHRDSDKTPRDPHSVEMLMLSELGIVGLALFGTFIATSAISGLRSRRQGPSAAALATGSLAAGAYWLMHASYDWFWRYPALTALVIFLLGAAAAPSLSEAAAIREKVARRIGIAVLAVAIAAAVPLFLSQRYANRAYDEAQDNPAAAFDDLDRAASLDPFDPEPLLAKGVIAFRLGQPVQAASAFRDAIDRQRDNYAPHFLLARTLAQTDPAAARAQAEEALRLNPLDPQTRNLARGLQRRGPP